MLRFHERAHASAALLQCNIRYGIKTGRRLSSGQRNGPSGSALTRRKTIVNLLTTYKSWRNYRNTVSELCGLSNSELDDIGVGRSEIRSIARKAVR